MFLAWKCAAYHSPIGTVCAGRRGLRWQCATHADCNSQCERWVVIQQMCTSNVDVPLSVALTSTHCIFGVPAARLPREHAHHLALGQEAIAVCGRRAEAVLVALGPIRKLCDLGFERGVFFFKRCYPSVLIVGREEAQHGAPGASLWYRSS